MRHWKQAAHWPSWGPNLCGSVGPYILSGECRAVKEMRTRAERKTGAQSPAASAVPDRGCCCVQSFWSSLARSGLPGVRRTPLAGRRDRRAIPGRSTWWIWPSLRRIWSLTSSMPGLLIWDAYRPLSVQQEMWDLIQDPRYVGDPAKGTRHARACAVDLTLTDREGSPVAMPTGFDHFGPEAGVDCPGHPPDVRARALLLRQAMMAAGFRPSSTEWWHFSDVEWELYPELDLPLDVAVPEP